MNIKGYCIFRWSYESFWALRSLGTEKLAASGKISLSYFSPSHDMIPLIFFLQKTNILYIYFVRSVISFRFPLHSLEFSMVWLLYSRVVYQCLLSLNCIMCIALQMLQTVWDNRGYFSVLAPAKSSPHLCPIGFGGFYIFDSRYLLCRYGNLTRFIKDGFRWQNWHCLRTRVIRFMLLHGHQILAGKFLQFFWNMSIICISPTSSYSSLHQNTGLLWQAWFHVSQAPWGSMYMGCDQVYWYFPL